MSMCAAPSVWNVEYPSSRSLWTVDDDLHEHSINFKHFIVISQQKKEKREIARACRRIAVVYIDRWCLRSTIWTLHCITAVSNSQHCEILEWFRFVFKFSLFAFLMPERKIDDLKIKWISYGFHQRSYLLAPRFLETHAHSVHTYTKKMVTVRWFGWVVVG